MIAEATYLPLTADDVVLAQETLEGVVYRTPLVKSEFLSKLYGCHISFKLENVQKTGSFKIRGAYNTIASLNKWERQRGLIAASSGNHAQGVAYSAQLFGIAEHTTIFMPQSTPQTKIDNTRRYGVNIELIDGAFDVCAEIAHQRADETGATYIEPYNDWRIIAGQGTIGLEIMQDAPDTDVILCPVGGGGLIAGISLATHSIKPSVRVIGIQAQYAQPSGYTIADGIRVKHPGEKPLQVIREHVEQLVKVDETAIGGAVLAMAQYVRLLVEGSGAVGLAALMTHTVAFAPDTQVVIVVSGGNMDLMRLQNLVSVV
jgi:threonine dehydratase